MREVATTEGRTGPVSERQLIEIRRRLDAGAHRVTRVLNRATKRLEILDDVNRRLERLRPLERELGRR